MKKLLLVMVAIAAIAAACGDSSDGGSAADYCKFANDAAATQADLDESDFSPGSIEEIFTEIHDLTGKAVKIAPAEIKADMTTLNAKFGEVVAGLKAAEWNLLAAPEVLALLEDPELAAASDRISAYDEANCA